MLHPIPTSADAGSDLCTLCPSLCTLHPDLVVFPFFQHSTCTGGGCHQLQLALVVVMHICIWMGHGLQTPSYTIEANILWLGGCIYYNIAFSSDIIIHTYVYSVLARHKGLSLSVHVTQNAAIVCGWVNIPTIPICRWATDKIKGGMEVSNFEQQPSFPITHVRTYVPPGRQTYVHTHLYSMQHRLSQKHCNWKMVPLSRCSLPSSSQTTCGEGALRL